MIIPFAIAAIALALRAYHLGYESLWFDEAASVAIASRPFEGVLASELTNPPLYYLLLHYWMKLFGSGEAAIRWFSVWPSVGAVPVLYLLARRLYDPRVAILAATFMAVSPYQIYYGQEARTFALLLFLSLCSTSLFQLILSRPPGLPSLGLWLAYGLFTIAALYAHYHAVFVVAAQNLFFALYWKRHRHLLGGWIVAQVCLVVAFAPWLVTMLQAAAAGGQIRRYLPLKLPQAVASFLVGDTLVPFDEAAVVRVRETLLSHTPLIAAFTVAFGIYLIAGIRAFASRAYSNAFSAVMCLVPLLVPFIVSFSIVIFDRRYVIAASPMLYMLLAWGAVQLHERAVSHDRRALWAHLLAGFLVISLMGFSLYNYYFDARFGKEQWRDVVSMVEVGYVPGDLVVLEPAYLQMSYDYYSSRDVRKLGLPLRGFPEEAIAWASIVSAEKKTGRIWLIQSHLSSEATVSRLRRIYPRVSHRHFPKAKGIDVYLLER